MNAGEFSLSALTSQVLSESDSEDREQILKEIASRVPAKLLGEAFRQALPAFVHQARVRWTLPLPQPEPSAGSRAKGTSAKVSAIRDAWQKQLEGRYTVEDGSLRRLGDFCHADLAFKASELEDKAQRNHARAAAMLRLADALAEHEAERVRDLPLTVLRGFFTEQAAA